MNAHRIIGKGTFGVVVEPALPNVDQEGRILTFGPDKVTKIMLDHDDYKKTLDDATTIAEKIPSLSTNITPYRRAYTEQNIVTLPHMRNFIDEHGSSNGIYMVRMSNLGINLWDIVRSKSQMDSLRSSVPPSQIIRQILKLMRVVKAIGQAGYIHADIRETNVLCSNTGELTIIDFDWLMTSAKIQKKYPVYFYCHPPESMFLLDQVTPIDSYLLSKPDRSDYRDILYDMSIDYMKKNNRDEFWQNIQLHGTTREEFSRKIVQNMLELYDTATRIGAPAALKRFREIYYHTADSFGLAVALKVFTEEFFNRQEDMTTRRFLRDILFKEMTHTGSKRRMTIERAIILLQDFSRVYFPDIELGEAVSFTGEVARLGAMVNLMSEKRKRSEERRTLRQQVEGLALMTKYMEGSPKIYPLLPPSPPSSGRRTGSSSNNRRTRKKSSRG